MPLTLWKQDLMPSSPGHSIFQEPNTPTWRTQSWRLILTVGLKKSCTALPQNHLQKSCSLRAILATPARNRVWFLPKTHLLEKAILILLPQGLPAHLCRTGHMQRPLVPAQPRAALACIAGSRDLSCFSALCQARMLSWALQLHQTGTCGQWPPMSWQSKLCVALHSITSSHQ